MKITKEDAETILAFHDGKSIQYYSDTTNRWMNVRGVPIWSFGETKYRVKPEPKELWVNEYDSGCVGVHKEKHEAVESAQNDAIRIAVHYREVIEG